MSTAQRTLLSLTAILLPTLSASTVLAQELSVRTALSDSTVVVGDTVTMEITVTSKMSGTIRVTLPRVEGLAEISRQQRQSTAMSWQSSRQNVLIEQVFTIGYRADRVGRLTIPPVEARVGKRKAKSTSVTLTVQGPNDIAAAAPAAANEVTGPGPGDGPIFLRYRLDQEEPFLGEAVLLDLEVITRPGQSFRVEETTGLPEVEGFWTQILEKPTDLKRRSITIDGQRYVSYRIWRAALYPLQAGQHTLPPVSMQFSQGSRAFLRNRLRRRTLPIRLEVKPLPSKARPSSFVSVNVGQYKLTATVDRRRVEAGKAIIYTLRLSGRGNIASAKLPTIDQLRDFRVFAPTVREKIDLDAMGVSGYKEAQYLLMPTKGGRLTIPSIELPVFDPVKGRYRRLKSKPLRVFVEGRVDPSVAAAIGAPADEGPGPETDQPQELRDLRFTSDLSALSSPPWTQPWFWILLVLPGLASMARFGWTWARRSDAPVSPRVTHRSSFRQAHAELAAARKHVEAGAYAEAHAKVAAALRAAGSQALGVSLRGLTHDAIAEATTARGLSADDASDLVRMLEAADYARYAPGRLSEAAARSDIYRTEQLVTTFSRISNGGREEAS